MMDDDRVMEFMDVIKKQRGMLEEIRTDKDRAERMNDQVSSPHGTIRPVSPPRQAARTGRVPCGGSSPLGPDSFPPKPPFCTSCNKRAATSSPSETSSGTA